VIFETAVLPLKLVSFTQFSLIGAKSDGKNENSGQTNARFHFFHSIFLKSKYMSHPFSISAYRKPQIAPIRLNCVAGIGFGGGTAVSKISYQVFDELT